MFANLSIYDDAVIVTEIAEGEDCSLFKHYIDGEWYKRMLAHTDDAPACTRAIRIVSGSSTALHPRDWK